MRNEDLIKWRVASVSVFSADIRKVIIMGTYIFKHMLRKLILAIVLFFILVPPSSAFFVTTDATTTDITAGGATLHADATDVVNASIVFFEYSGLSGTYIYKTANQTIQPPGNPLDPVAFSAVLSGAPLISGKTYYFRVVGYDGGYYYGDEESFSTLPLSTIADYNFDAHFDNLTNSELEPTNMSKVAASPYIDIFGTIFWGILYALIFIMIWIRQEDITIPSLLGLIVGVSLWASMPQDWVSMAMSLTVMSFAGLVYSLLKRGS